MKHLQSLTEKGIYTLDSTSPEETYTIGIEIGSDLPPGSIITLHGDLGSGKTAFVQGLAKGLGVPETYYVNSPTYTIINEYPGHYPLYHIDLYRISEPDELYDIGFDDLLTDIATIAIEWPERLPEGLLSPTMEIHITIVDYTSRRFTITIL